MCRSRAQRRMYFIDVVTHNTEEGGTDIFGGVHNEGHARGAVTLTTNILHRMCIQNNTELEAWNGHASKPGYQKKPPTSTTHEWCGVRASSSGEMRTN